ncbi:hypothetical protein CDL15_Pgr019600 [Punica granatum]|nr:hypothetical protein CDL15_Pgr019600 [Punica granatum]
MNLQQMENMYLNSNKLTGLIPSQLGSLIHLESHELSLNRFHGPVPSSVSHLSNLAFLNLYANNLSGDLRLGMFSVLKSLNTLVLSFNYFFLLHEPNASESYPLFSASQPAAPQRLGDERVCSRKASNMSPSAATPNISPGDHKKLGLCSSSLLNQTADAMLVASRATKATGELFLYLL